MLRNEPTPIRYERVLPFVIALAVVLTLPVDASHLSIVDPVNTWIDTITGPVAFGLGVLIFVGLGIAFGFSKIDFQQLGITGVVTILVLGLVFFSRPLIRELFGATTPAGALLGF